MRHLESHGLRCAYAGDIATGQDASWPARTMAGPDSMITNPPYSRQNLMHRLIRALPANRPDLAAARSDWAGNQAGGAVHALHVLRTSVDASRVSNGFPEANTKDTGKDNSRLVSLKSPATAAGPILRCVSIQHLLSSLEQACARSAAEAVSAAPIELQVLFGHMPAACTTGRDEA